MARVATVASILSGMTEAATLRDFTLFHSRKDGEFDVRLIGQGVRRAPFWPLVLRPCVGVAFGFALGELL